MTPAQLVPLLTGLDRAADLVEAMDDPALQAQRGWDLSNWGYALIPWGVRFAYFDPSSRTRADVLALVAFDAPASLLLGIPARQAREVIVRLFN